MRVKIKDKIYDAEKEPIMVILSTSEREQIYNMSLDCKGMYCQYPDTEEWIKDDYKKIREWLKIEDKE